MKKKFVLTGFLGFAFLFGCNQIDNGEVSASLPTGFTITTEEDNEINRHTVTVMHHNDTGCNYIIIDGNYSGGITQMFVEKDGVSVPYCDK